MKNLLVIVLMLWGVTFAYAQSTINSIEYWFNNDYANKATIQAIPNQKIEINQSISTTGISNGLNVLNFRSVDNSGRFSSTLSSLFYKTSTHQSTSNTGISAYEYWIDNDYEGKVMVNTPNQLQVDILELVSMAPFSTGLHNFNIRFRDNTDKWSSTMTHFFYKGPVSESFSTPKITEYEYWLNNDYENAVKVIIPTGRVIDINELITLHSLSGGSHIFNIRFKDNADLWSSISSHLLYKSPQQNTTDQNKIIGYRYWFNNDINQAINVSLPLPARQEDIIANLDLSQIEIGQHIIHFQFKDALGKWSVVSDASFERTITVSVIENSFKANVLAYPNPTNGKVYVDLGEYLTDIKVSILTLNGKLIRQTNFTNSQSLEIEISEPTGIYLMTISSGNKHTTIKLIKH